MYFMGKFAANANERKCFHNFCLLFFCQEKIEFRHIYNRLKNGNHFHKKPLVET